MDYEDSASPREGWEANATRLWSIPLHPLGEMDIGDFVLRDPNNADQVRARLQGLYHQLIFNILLSSIFIRNFNIARKMVMMRIRTLPGWCCLLPSLFGMLVGIIAALSLFPTGLTCRKIAWYVGFAITFSLLCNSVILLQKAYLVLCRPRWVLIVGGLFMLPQLGYMYIAWMLSPITLNSASGCVVNYPTFLPVYWFGSAVPLNAFFSGIFSYVAYKQYQKYGSKAWKRMARDGIQTMSIVILCNIICGLIIMFRLGGNISEMFFLTDWVITTSVLVDHCCNMRKTAESSKLSANELSQHIKPEDAPHNHPSTDSNRQDNNDADWASISLLTKGAIGSR
ncbi:hypothetical protein BDF19DRAFT_421337 [Syncephalis fuscata]|nr:hypothetical protein BDF19DRAFT_421337 [Syncephalis fuscata]